MSEITEKVLRSGLIDRHTAEMMEHFGMLPEGSAAETKEGVAKEQMAKLAEELALVVEREHKIRETSLDLERLRWPTMVSILSGDSQIAGNVNAVIDRMGRYYFRPRDVNIAWFVPGRQLERHGCEGKEMIVEAQELFVGEQVAAIQVSVVKA